MALSQSAAETQDKDFHYRNDQSKFLDTLEREARERFPFNSVYPSVIQLRSAVREWSESVGASISHEGNGLKCSRSHAPEGCEKRKETRRVKNRITKEKQRETKSSRCGCKFEIKSSTARRGLPPDAPKTAVRITHGSHYRHTNGCFPCQTQLIADKRRAGNYKSGLKEVQLRSIIEVLKPRKSVPIKVLREMMRPLYPATVEISAQDVCNMRYKVNIILDRMEKESEEAGNSGSGLSSSDEDNILLMDDRSVAEDFDNAAAAEEEAEPEAISIDSAAPQAQDPALASYSYNDIMAICKDISGHIVRQPDLAVHVGMLLQFRDHLRDGGDSNNAGSAESCSFEETFRKHISDVVVTAASHPL
jgi:hypothetical protein